MFLAKAFGLTIPGVHFEAPHDWTVKMKFPQGREEIHKMLLKFDKIEPKSPLGPYALLIGETKDENLKLKFEGKVYANGVLDGNFKNSEKNQISTFNGNLMHDSSFIGKAPTSVTGVADFVLSRDSVHNHLLTITAPGFDAEVCPLKISFANKAESILDIGRDGLNRVYVLEGTIKGSHANREIKMKIKYIDCSAETKFKGSFVEFNHPRIKAAGNFEYIPKKPEAGTKFNGNFTYELVTNQNVPLANPQHMPNAPMTPEQAWALAYNCSNPEFKLDPEAKKEEPAPRRPRMFQPMNHLKPLI
jgi:hypothetical protein